MMYIVMSNGVIEFDEIMQTAMARVLMEVTDKTDTITVTQMDLKPGEVVRDEATGGIKLTKDPKTFKHNTLVYPLNSEQIKAVKQLHFLAENAMNLRDGLMLSCLSEILKPKTNELNFDKFSDGTGLDG